MDAYGYYLVALPEDIGAVIRARRRKLGYTQEEVAAFNQCSPRFLGELERGKNGANIKLVMQIANSLGIDFYMGIRGDED